MAFVQVAKAKGVTKETFDALRREWLGDGLADGMLFLVGGPGEDGWFVVDAWESREKCNASMARFMGVVERLGIEPPQISEEEFSLDFKVLG